MATNHMAGFVYGGVLYRRHTKLGTSASTRSASTSTTANQGVGKLLLDGIGAEARQMGIDRGFAFTTRPRPRRHASIYDSVGGQRSADADDPLRLRVLTRPTGGPYAAGHV